MLFRPEIMTWFTQPPGDKYSSCYAYHRDGRFVRIRLELGREIIYNADKTMIVDDGHPCILFHKNRAVGFGNGYHVSGTNKYGWHHHNGHVFYDRGNSRLDYSQMGIHYRAEQDRLIEAGGGILYCFYDVSKEVRKLSWEPKAGLKVFDFNITNHRRPDSVHSGNEVTDHPNFPLGIDEEQMKLLAKAILEDGGVRLSGQDTRRHDNGADWYYIITHNKHNDVEDKEHLAHKLQNIMREYNIR